MANQEPARDNGFLESVSEPARRITEILGAFGLGSIVVVVIGRLWTISYFEYFGLSTGDLEFSVADFAFRSIEVWVSLGLAAAALFLASSRKSAFQRGGVGFFILEVSLVAAMLTVMWGVHHRWFPDGWLTSPGVLGLIAGLTLGAMIWPVADIWFGSAETEADHETPEDMSQQGLGLNAYVAHEASDPDDWIANGSRWIGSRLRLVKKTASKMQSFAIVHRAMGLFSTLGRLSRPVYRRIAERRDAQGRYQTRPVFRFLGSNLHRIFAGLILLAIVFGYLPFVIRQLGTLEAQLDLRQGQLPVAIVETVEDPLPADIASHASGTTSNLVRVVLAQRENTYVLHSTQCKAIGEPDVNREKTERGLTIVRDTNLCKVFAIPSRRVKSIEYRSVTGSPPPNDTPFLAASIAADDPSQPFKATVSTDGASNEEDIKCGKHEDNPFRHTIWYEIEPATEGVLFARVDSLTEGLSPAIGIWPDTGRAVPAWEDETGCQTQTVGVPRQDARSLGLTGTGTARRVGTLASLQANEKYFIGIGASSSKETRRDSCSEEAAASGGTAAGTPAATPDATHRTEGDVHIFIQFFPDGELLGAPAETSDVPSGEGAMPSPSPTPPKSGDEIPRTQSRTSSVTIEPSLPLGRVELELRAFDECTYALIVPAEQIRRNLPVFSLSSDQATLSFQEAPQDNERMTFVAQGLVLPDVWRLSTDEEERHDEVLLANLVIPEAQPNLILALEASAPGKNQREDVRNLEAVLQPPEFDLGGSLVFAQGSVGDLPELGKAKDAVQGKCIVLNAVGQPDRISQEELALGTAVTAVADRLREVGAAVDLRSTDAEEGCEDEAFRVQIYFVRSQQEVSEVSAFEQDGPASGENESEQDAVSQEGAPTD